MSKVVSTLIRFALIVGLISVMFWGMIVGLITSPLWISFILINTPTVVGVYLLFMYTNVSKIFW